MIYSGSSSILPFRSSNSSSSSSDWLFFT